MKEKISISFINLLFFLGLAKPAQKKNANLANSGGCMVIKPEVDEGAAGGGYIDRLLQVTEPMANNRAR